MSYEIDDIKEMKCPCNKGKIRRISKSNDWSQRKESMYIDCDECSKNYEIVSEYFCPKPYHDYTIYYLKNKNSGDKIKIDL